MLDVAVRIYPIFSSTRLLARPLLVSPTPDSSAYPGRQQHIRFRKKPLRVPPLLDRNAEILMIIKRQPRLLEESLGRVRVPRVPALPKDQGQSRSMWRRGDQPIRRP